MGCEQDCLGFSQLTRTDIDEPDYQKTKYSIIRQALFLIQSEDEGCIREVESLWLVKRQRSTV